MSEKHAVFQTDGLFRRRWPLTASAATAAASYGSRKWRQKYYGHGGKYPTYQSGVGRVIGVHPGHGVFPRVRYFIDFPIPFSRPWTRRSCDFRHLLAAINGFVRYTIICYYFPLLEIPFSNDRDENATIAPTTSNEQSRHSVRQLSLKWLPTSAASSDNKLYRLIARAPAYLFSPFSTTSPYVRHVRSLIVSNVFIQFVFSF